MIKLRKSNERGHFDHGWLNTYHTFSFADYHDPDHMGYRSLRVINEDRVEGGQGFGTHPHRNMEIITYILEGELEHKDSMGNGSIIKPGDVQYMSAGKGVLHSEFNASKTLPVHLAQIWILPKVSGLAPSYHQKYFSENDRLNNLKLVASADGRLDSIKINQDADLYASILEKGHSLNHEISTDRGIWLQLLRGEVNINNQSLIAGDGISIESIPGLTIKGLAARSEFLLFDLI